MTTVSTTNSTPAPTTPAPKESKAARLARQLVEAEAKYEAACKLLSPQIKAAYAEYGKLESEYSRLSKLRTQAYFTAEAVEKDCAKRLGLDGKSLDVQLSAFVVERGLPHASVQYLHKKYVSQRVAADDLVCAARAEVNDLHQQESVAYRKYNTYDKLHKLRRELEKYEQYVVALRTELSATPERNKSARERREAARADALQGEQTDAAMRLLGEFVFTATTEEV